MNRLFIFSALALTLSAPALAATEIKMCYQKSRAIPVTPTTELGCNCQSDKEAHCEVTTLAVLYSQGWKITAVTSDTVYSGDPSSPLLRQFFLERSTD